MTNPKDEQCPFCNAFDEFTLGLEMGSDMQESFHNAVGNLVDSLLEEASENIYEAGFEDSSRSAYSDGYIESMRVIADQIIDSADALEAKLMDDNECDCDKCSCDDEDDKLTNDEKLARRAMWEDEV